MRPAVWQPAIALSPAEQAIVARIRRAKLFVFLRRVRHALFSPAFQTELAGIYRDRDQGHPAVSPAQLALATLEHSGGIYIPRNTRYWFESNGTEPLIMVRCAAKDKGVGDDRVYVS